MNNQMNHINININLFPSELHIILNNGKLFDSSSSKEATVLYIDSGYYLKIAPINSLKYEYQNTIWFNSKGLTTKVIKYISFNNKDYLLTEKAQGKISLHFLNEPKLLCKALASFLFKLHSLPVKDFPIKTRMDQYLSLAETNYNKNCYDYHVLLPRFNINSKDEAWELIQNNKHKLKRNAIIHGDFCLPNILLNDNFEITEIIDLENAGIGDKHIDLFWAIWSLNYNLNTDVFTDCFLENYGKNNYNYEMIKLIAAIEVFR